MLDNPRTLAEAMKYRYAEWSGRPDGVPFNPENCAYEIFPVAKGIIHYQCRFKPGHGPANLYCKTHAKKVKP